MINKRANPRQETLKNRSCLARGLRFTGEGGEAHLQRKGGRPLRLRPLMDRRGAPVSARAG